MPESVKGDNDMTSFDDFWRSIPEDTLDEIGRQIMQRAANADSPAEVSASAVMISLKLILSEYHEWLVSNFLQK